MLPPRISVCGALLLAALVPVLRAQSVTTTPVGAVTISIPAGPANVIFGVPLKSDSIYNGSISSSSSSSITVEGTPFAGSNLSTAISPFFLRIVSGAQSGRVLLITANSASSVTLDLNDGTSTPLSLDTSGFAVAIGDKVEITPADTLASLFGTGVDLKITGGTNSGNADTVSLWNGTRFVAYYYNTAQGFWMTQGLTESQNNKIIRPEESVGVGRKASRPAFTLTFIGTVPTHPQLFRYTNGQRLFAHIFPTDTTLSKFAFGLSGSAALNTGTNTGNADTVSLWNGTRWIAYYKNTNTGQWLKSGDSTDYSNLVIPAGTALGIARKATASGAQSFLGYQITYPTL